jgi:hypothetical protein
MKPNACMGDAIANPSLFGFGKVAWGKDLIVLSLLTGGAIALRASERRYVEACGVSA